MSQYASYSGYTGGAGLGTVTAVTASSPLASSGGTAPNITIQLADATHDGYLSATDWIRFDAKETTALTSAHILVGNGSNVATDVAVSGDLSLINTGAFTIVNNAITTVKIINSAVTNAKIANMANNTIKGNQSGISAAPSDLSLSSVTEAVSSVLTISNGSNTIVGSSNLTIQVAQSSGSVSGYLSSTDWTTFNNKQASGNYITALTGDVTASGPGSVAATLATVNSNVGSFGSSTAIPSFTVNGKGLITAASTNVVIAPAGTLSGTTLNATVVSSSLTSVGTITTGVWSGTTIAISKGGTGQVTASAAFAALSPLTTKGDVLGYDSANNRIPIGSDGQVLTADSAQTLGLKWATPGTNTFGSAVYSGGFENGSTTVYWGTNSSSFADFSPVGTPVLTANYNSGIGTVTAAGSNLPGITISSAPKTGTLRIICSSSCLLSTLGDWSVQLVDGSNVFINACSGHNNAVNSPGAFSIIGYYDVTASSSYTFKVRGKVSSGTLYLNSGDNDLPYMLDFSVEYVK